jgi:hypothetical protein
MLGELELALEGAPGNALMEIGGLVALFALAADREDGVLHFDAEILLGEAGDGDGDAIMVFIAAFDVVGRIARRAFGGLEQIQQAVKADSAAEAGGNNQYAWSTS